MNMAINSAPTASGKSAAMPAAGSASGAASGSGFTSALVQAIDGGNTSGSVNSGLSLPVAMTGLLGKLDMTSEESQDLLALLSNLVDQLQQAEEDDVELSPELQDQLAGLLAAFQGLLEQINLGQTKSDSSEQATSTQNSQTVPIVQISEEGKTVVRALRETLQTISSAIASGAKDAEQTSAFAGQLKELLTALNATQSDVSNAAKQAVSDTVYRAASAAKAEVAIENGTAIPKDSIAENVSIQETRRPAQAFRDPAWRFQMTANSDTSSVNGQNVAAVSGTSSADQSNASDSQPAWTFMQNDSLANSEPATAKATLPAQVPVQQFAEQMGKFLVKQFQLTQGNGTTEAKLSLTPEHLGQVDIRIVMHNGQLTAQFIAGNPAAREMLENQMAQLRAALNGQGLQVERLEVVQQPPSSAGTSLMHQEQRHSNSGNGNGSNGRSDNAFEDPTAFADEMERNSSLKEIGYGSSINVTA
ncbi:flagellar hook-length control protein FliK [Cohnella terricola]|uniref:Flagellar hook-length control protein FliK n=1 Tax=Cohnella terricola TaxID=1289167 RepID=A0A559JCT2_9BACL|nr:flagellar hook-length control protein FliK [Cohnella terricola]TVX97663.1 flagellar hook-length control protein FliK [Cohnella terricola]